MSVGIRRSELEIIRDILQMDVGRTTALRYNANLSHPQMQKYLLFLQSSQLIHLERQGPRSQKFQVTGRGKMALEQLDQLFDLMGLESLGELNE